MKLSKNLRECADIASCVHEVLALEGVIRALEESTCLNVAILGETKCGKTTLMNRLAGKEIRRASMMPAEEAPLMAAACPEAAKAGYEAVILEDAQALDGLAFYELPINLAIDYETKALSLMLEEMDAVVYILSAMTPMTASDTANIAALAERLPVLYYVSKADRLEDLQEREECFAYIRQQLDGQAESVVLLDGSQENSAGLLLEALKGFSAGELRSLHAARLERLAADLVSERLNAQIARLDAERVILEEKKAAADSEYRRWRLLWNDLRVQFLERKEAAVKDIEKKTDQSRADAQERLVRHVEAAGSAEGLQAALETELRDALEKILPTAEERVDADVSWLICEANRKLGTRIAAGSAEIQVEVFSPDSPADAARKPGPGRIAAAVGSGLLAGGAVLSSMTLLPTCVVALPASAAALHFLRKNRDDQKAYREELTRMVRRSCQQSFQQIGSDLRCGMERQYGRILEFMQERNKLCEDPRLDEIAREKNELLDRLEALRAGPQEINEGAEHYD